MELRRLKECRETVPLSQQELADLAGVAKTTVGLLERGITRARPSTARKLAAALRRSVAELTGGGGDVTRADVALLPHAATPELVLGVRHNSGMVPVTRRGA